MAEVDDHYVCTLSEASLKKAKEELHEDPKNRIGAVETLRKWINEQPHLKAKTDTEYLLRFLRAAKFSQLKARETLEVSLKGKKMSPTWVNNLKVTDEIIKFLRDTKFIVPLPKRNQEGQLIVFADEGAFDPSIHSKDMIMQVCWIITTWMLQSEETQVNGFIFFMDLTKFGLKHQTFWKLEDLRKMFSLFQKGTPGRFKGFHYYNINMFFEAVFQLLLPLLTKKFKDRIVLHGSNMESVYKVIPHELLPLEYLPDDYKGPNAGSMNELVENLINELRDPTFQAALEDESSTVYYIDESKRPADAEPAASFRKLNVD